MPQIDGVGVALHYEERGGGAPLLVLHGMASDAEAWSPQVDALAAGGFRAIAFDRRGYGASGAPEVFAATTIQEQAEDAAALLAGLDALPAVLVGDGFGALVALELLVRRPEVAVAAVLADLPLFAFVPAATEALAAQREQLEAALREGGPAAAVRAWAGDDAVVPARAASWERGFFADYAGQASWSPSRRELRGVDVPVVLVTGPRSAPHVVAASEAAAALVPGARRVLDGDVVRATLGLA